MKFPFYDSPDTAAIICCHIMENQTPILYVSHDEDDGMWQFLCGEAHGIDDAKLVSLKWVFDLDNSVSALKDMPIKLNKVFLSESKIPICREVTESVISEFDILENRN